MADVKPIPDNYPQLVPDLCVDGADAAIGFYRTVFGAFERMRMPEPDGRLGHAQVEIGSTVIMLSDEFPALCRRRGAHRRRRSMIRAEPRPPLHHGSRIGVVTHRAGALADGFASAWRQANDRLSKLVDRELQAGVDQSVRQKVPGRGVARPPARPAGSPSWTRRMA